MFQKATAIYGEIPQNEMHTLVRFSATAELGGATLRIAAADFYRVYADGSFVAFGPARTAAGYARVDEIPLPAGSRLVIEVLSHNCKSLSTVKQAPFLVAEVTRGEEVLLYTGRDFSAMRVNSFVRSTERYSSQRHFTEEWDLRFADEPIAVRSCVAPTFLLRRAPYPHYEDLTYAEAVVCGALEEDAARTPRRNFRSFSESDWGAFPDDAVRPLYTWIDGRQQIPTAQNCPLPISLASAAYAIFDMRQIECGFLSLTATASEETELVIAFSEDSELPVFSFTDMHAHNVFGVKIPAEETATVSTFEPYVCRFVMVAVMRGCIQLQQVGLKTYMADLRGACVPDIADPALARIYRGAMRTYAHNAVDLYTDCPSRERAGWLCDSYFTARAEYALFGRTPVEDAFLENYRLFANRGEYPDGVLPMCYPSDKRKEAHEFIPQWDLWYILEVSEYLLARGHAEQKELFRPSVYGVLSFFARYENADGLLERLPAWNFVEWSVANQWTWDVNYPTNFLYAEALTCVYRIWGEVRYLEKAEHIRAVACKQSFDGKVFRDHAVRDGEGRLSVLPDVSEACQYYAILFGGISEKDPQYAALFRLVREVFGADRTTLRAEIAPINAFIGVYLRLEVLRRLGDYPLLLADMRDFFGEMEARTGTLWEYRERHGSRDHGFASYVIALIREALVAE